MARHLGVGRVVVVGVVVVVGRGGLGAVRWVEDAGDAFGAGHFGEIPHPAQQTPGNTRRSTRTPRSLT